MSFEKASKYTIRTFDNGKSSISPNNFQYFGFEPSTSGNFINTISKQKLKKTKWGNNSISKIDACIFSYEEHNRTPDIFYLDIETHVGLKSHGFPYPRNAVEEISLMQILYKDKIFIIGDKEFYYREEYLKQLNRPEFTIKYIHCDSEKEILQTFLKLINIVKPIVIFAWNGDGFDFPYIYRRLTKNDLDTELLSGFNEEIKKFVTEKTVELKEKEINGLYDASLKSPDCYFIDLKKLYAKIILTPRQSYSLDYIANLEIGSEKLDHSEFATFEDFYNGNYQKPLNPTEKQSKTMCYINSGKVSPEELKKMGHGQFILYGIIDVILMKDLDDKLRLSSIMIGMSEKLKSNWDYVLGTVKPWGNKLQYEYIKKGMVVDTFDCDDYHVVGGFVLEPNTETIKKQVVSFDVNSMYPNMIYSNNLSPETFVSLEDLRIKYSSDATFKKLMELYVKLGLDHQDQDETRLLNASKEDKELLGKYLKELNLIMSPAGYFFYKNVDGLMSKLVRGIFLERKEIKKKMKELKQQLKALETQDA